jgi:hypothetical protein
MAIRHAREERRAESARIDALRATPRCVAASALPFKFAVVTLGKSLTGYFSNDLRRRYYTRHFDCAHYERCLNAAEKLASFSCHECSVYESALRGAADLPFEVQHSPTWRRREGLDHRGIPWFFVEKDYARKSHHKRSTAAQGAS